MEMQQQQQQQQQPQKMTIKHHPTMTEVSKSPTLHRAAMDRPGARPVRLWEAHHGARRPLEPRIYGMFIGFFNGILWEFMVVEQDRMGSNGI